MKRLIAYISLICMMILGIGVGIVPALLDVNGTGEYETQHTYVYKISEKSFDVSNGGTTDDGDISDEDKEDRLDDTVSEIKDRLSNADVSDYNIETSGFDTIKVTFKVDNNLYEDVSSYLNFSWSLKASTFTGDPVVGQDANQVVSNSGEANFFDSGSARIEYKDNYPYIVVSLSNPEDFKTVYTAAKDAEGSSDSDSSETDEEDTTVSNENKIYILNDWIDGLTVESLVNKNNAYLKESQIREHLLFTLDATDPSSFYWDYDASLSSEEQENAVYDELYFGGYNLNSTNGYYGDTVSDRVLAYKKANIWMHKFNSNSFDWQVTLVNENGTYDTSAIVSPTNGFLVFMNEIQWGNGLFIASFISLCVVVLFLILNYGLNGLTSSVTTFGLIITSIGLFNAFGSEFNNGAIIGLIALATISIFTNVVFFKKIKDDMYNGKNIKKAFNDGSKKSLSVQLDFTVITLILGITAYLLPSSILTSFGSLFIVGSLLNIILNIIGVRAISWLLYNSSFIANRVNLIGVDKKYIPNLSKDEKPTFFEQFKTKASKKTKIISLSISALFLVASIVGLITFSFTRGNIYNSLSSEQNSEVVIRVDARNVDEDDKNEINTYISQIKTIFATEFYTDETTPLFKNADAVNVVDYNYSYIVNNVTNKEYYFVVTLDGVYDLDSTIYSYDNSDSLTLMNFNDALQIQVINQFQANDVSISSVYNVNNDSNNYYVLLFACIGISVVSIYMLLRYNISKTLTSILIIGGSSVITVGVFSLVSASFSSIITLGLLFIITFGYLILVSLFNKEKEVYNENKKELLGLDQRFQAYEYSFNNVFNTIIIASIISLFIVISLLFATGVDQYLVMLMLIGSIIVLVLIKTLSLPIEKTFTTLFFNLKNKIKQNKENNKKNKPKKAKEKDNEGPEESIFVGIND